MKWLLSLILIAGVWGCEDPSDAVPTPTMTLEELMDPESCRTCHASIVEQWEGSMHAFASHDPVFLAMNQRGQRETDGALGDFCVQCHAPVAVALGLTEDGLNLHELPASVRGVTCYACHNAVDVTGTHNNPVTLGMDKVMRGGLQEPVGNTAHASAYSTYLDRNTPDSSALCGACHDIVTPAGIHIERTYLEWQESIYASEAPGQFQSCGSCHMGAEKGVAAEYPGVPLRTIHDHGMPGVDQAVAPWPGMTIQAEAIQRALDTTVYAAMCVFDGGDGSGRIQVQLENIGAGHSFPSGAAQDRRVWVEVKAMDEEGDVIYSSGLVEETDRVVDIEASDPDFWRLGDRSWKADGTPAHMFWDIASIQSDLLPAPAATDITLPIPLGVHLARTYKVPGGVPDRVTVKVKMRSLGRDFVEDLVESGDLDPGYLDEIKTFTLGLSALEWNSKDEKLCIPEGSLD